MTVATAAVIVVAGTAGCGGGSGSSSKSSGLLGGASASVTKSAGKSPSTGTSSSTDEDSTADASLDGVDFCGLLDPAAVTAIGISTQGSDATADGIKGCNWAQGHTTLSVHESAPTLIGFSNDIHQQDFAGFPGEMRYDQNLNECDIAIQVGMDGLRITLVNLGDDNPALKGKGCDVAADMAQHAMTKVKK